MSDTINSFFSFGQAPSGAGPTPDIATEGQIGVVEPVTATADVPEKGFFGTLLESGGEFLMKHGLGVLLQGGTTTLQIQSNTLAARQEAEEFFFEGRQALLAERVARLAGREERVQLTEQLERALATARAASAARGGTRGGSTEALLDFSTASARRGEQNLAFNQEVGALGFRIDAGNAFKKRRLALQQAKVRNVGLVSDFFLDTGRRVT